MSAGWVAGTVRSRALTRRTLGAARARALAVSGSLPAAVQRLAGTPYARTVPTGGGLAAAQHGIAEALLWNLRVLAGWLPAGGARTVRALTGWFEIANVDDHLRLLDGDPVDPPFRLGALATAWPRLRRAGSATDLRDALAASPWGDPGGTGRREIGLSMRAAWARRAATASTDAVPWAMGALALLVAAEQFAAGRPLPAATARTADTILGRAWSQAGDLADLRRRLPPDARWVLRGIDRPEQLWRAEAAWWARLRADGVALRGGAGFDRRHPIGAVALMAVDAWRVRAALELAVRGAAPEVLDAVA